MNLLHATIHLGLLRHKEPLVPGPPLLSHSRAQALEFAQTANAFAKHLPRVYSLVALAQTVEARYKQVIDLVQSTRVSGGTISRA